MSLYSALTGAVSGLNAQSTALGIISDNITNVNTIGYKASLAEFSTLVTETTGQNDYSAGGVQVRPRNLISEQGRLQGTESATDLAINGSGFFVVRTGGTNGPGAIQFTRAGSFRPDPAGDLRNTAGLYLQGWPLRTDGTYDNNGDLSKLVKVTTTGLSGTAEATTKAAVRMNLSSDQAAYTGAYTAGDLASGVVPAHFSRNVPVYDSLGGLHNITLAYLKTGVNDWKMEIYANPATDVTAPAGLLNTGSVKFKGDGGLDIAASSAALFSPNAITWTNGAAPSSITFDLGNGTPSQGLTQYQSPSTEVRSPITDGASFGNIAGVRINQDGIVTALFENGLTKNVFKIPVATFQNADGLTRVSGNAYTTSNESGNPSLVEAGVGGAGTIAPSQLEASKVDLAAEFTRLITTQRAFSAAGKIITTADDMLAELTNLKR